MSKNSGRGWPIAIVATLLVVALVNGALAWIAINDPNGGFKVVDGYDNSKK